MNSEIFFDMTIQDHPIYGQSAFLLKRWKKYTIYSKSGSYSHTNIPSNNLYSTCSKYLYDYVVVSTSCFSNLVYTASIADNTPSGISDDAPSNLWNHRAGTFRNSPNAITNNYLLTYNPTLSIAYNRPIYTSPTILKNTDTYFEIIQGYPRNHFTHKRSFFSLFIEYTYGATETSGVLQQICAICSLYFRNRQTSWTTVGEDGIDDGSLPIQSTLVSNVNLTSTTNAIN